MKKTEPEGMFSLRFGLFFRFALFLELFLELSVLVLPSAFFSDCFHHIPMFSDFSVLNTPQIVV